MKLPPRLISNSNEVITSIANQSLKKTLKLSICVIIKLSLYHDHENIFLKS